MQGKLVVDININAKGAVASFYDWQLMHTLDNDAPSEEEQFISSETAAARALKYLAAMGIDTNEYVLQRVWFHNGTVPASARSQAWYVDFDRVWQGVPYLDHYATLQLDAAQGRLTSGGAKGLGVLPPVIGRLDISTEQAIAVTRRAITQQAVEITGDADVELRVVLPNHFWTSNGNDYSPSTNQSRLAWRVRQPVIIQQRFVRTLEAWVDTMTGEILGGDNIGIRGQSKIIPLGGSIGRTLRAARSLQAIPVASPTATAADKQNSSKTRSLDVGNNKLRYYSVVAGLTGPILPLTGTQKPPASTLTFKPTHRLVATQADGKTITYLYETTTGRIATQDGLAGEVVQAGAGLRAWVSPVASTVAAPKIKQAAR